MAVSPAELVSRPLLEFDSATIAAAATRSFEDYVVPMVFDADSYERRFRSENLDAQASRLWFRGDELVGIVFIARRGWTCRLAAMAITVAYRHQGLGAHLLGTALAEAQARGDREMILEVMVQNPVGIRFYERMGFYNTQTQLGYEWRPEFAAAPTADLLEELDPLVLARLVAQEGVPDLPWLLAPETLAAAAPPTRAWHLQHRAYAMVKPEGDRNRILTLLVPREYRRQGWATRLLRALVATEPSKLWRVMPAVPENLGAELFQHLGWPTMEFSIYEMRRAL
jgi:ribosomal protein S18 acetylase RimI-like enzyme